MYRLLIVDNEPIIVDGLYDLFIELELDIVDLEVLKAYSASEALQLLALHKVDVVIADIQMPGTNGLELQQLIQARWPACKMIFLTGYNDFTYVQTAMRQGGMDYVLKTEGDDRILEAFHAAIASIQDDSEKERFLQDAKRDFKLAKPMLQKDLIVSLLEGERQFDAHIPQRLLELGIPLDTNFPLLMIVCRVDEWSETYSYSDRMLLTFALHNIAQEYLAASSMTYISYDRSRFVWLLQPRDTNGGEWDSFVQLVYETLDSIQLASRNLLKMTISLVTHRAPAQWDGLSQTFNHLNRLLGRGLGLGKEIMLTHTETVGEPDGVSDPGVTQTREEPPLQNFRFQIPLMEHYLERGSEREFSSLCSSMLHAALHDSFSYMEVYYSIATMILSYLNRMGATYHLLDRQDLDKLLRIEEHETWVAASDYLNKVVEQLFAKRQGEKEETSHSVITRLQQYIQSHLDDDLSLTRLSEVVFLNASYLSRLYKQTTGHGLAEYIAEKRVEKAMSLLLETPLKVHEIARNVGLEQGYFIKLFKKHTHATPHEFREAGTTGSHR